jgi:RNA polymerase sigma factor (sigma-70 family)
MRSVHERAAEDERLVLASRAGDESAFPALFDRWFDPCVDVAWRILHDRDAAADVAQETFLAAWRELDRLRQPSSFGGWVLRTARNRALNRLAGQRRSTVVGDEDLTAALDGGAPRPGSASTSAPTSAWVSDRRGEDEPAAAAERAEGAELVWAASAALGERDASVLDLHLRHGFTAPEIAEALGVTANNAHQLLFRLKRKLGGAIQAWVLWPAASRPGVAGCAGLRRAIDDAGVTRFGPEAVRVIDRHARDCDACQDRRQLRVAPEVLFGAVPIVPAGSILRARAVAALQAEGVPMPASGPSPSPNPSPSPDSGGSADSTDSGGPASPQDPGASPGGEQGRAKGRRWARAAVGVLVAAVVAGGLVVAASGGGDAGDEQGVSARGDGRGEADAGSDAETDAAASTTATSGGAAPTTAAEAGDTTGTSGATDSSGGGADDDPGAVSDPVGHPGPGGGSTDPDPDPQPPDPDPDPQPEPEPEPEPEIDRFTAVAGQPGGRPCQSAQRPVTLTWATTGADTATLAGPNVPTGAQPASGQTTACLDAGQQPATYTLTVTGPGGTATAVATP